VRTALQPHSKFIIGGGALQDIGNDFHGIVKPDLGMDKKGDIQEVRWWISIQLSIYWMESHVTALTLVRPIRKISARKYIFKFPLVSISTPYIPTIA
jgi:hypothetical protein